MDFLALFLSLPSKATADRVRIWRAIKAIGCATLRDGVYLLPDTLAHASALGGIANDVAAVDGSAEVYRLGAFEPPQDISLQALFDRQADFSAVVDDGRALQAELPSLEQAVAQRRLQALWRRFEHVVRIDFFAGEVQRQALAHLDAVSDAVRRRFAPDEPMPTQTAIARLKRTDYRGRTWATRTRPWVDRLASAWLIQRYIDPDATFRWLAQPADCEPGWLGFDFDGATFTHVGAKVTYETLLASFELDGDPVLTRIGDVVHVLDVGGLPVAEAPGVEALLAGLRAVELDDTRLFQQAASVFDWLERYYKERTNE